MKIHNNKIRKFKFKYLEFKSIRCTTSPLIGQSKLTHKCKLFTSDIL